MRLRLRKALLLRCLHEGSLLFAHFLMRALGKRLADLADALDEQLHIGLFLAGFGCFHDDRHILELRRIRFR